MYFIIRSLPSQPPVSKIYIMFTCRFRLSRRKHIEFSKPPKATSTQPSMAFSGDKSGEQIDMFCGENQDTEEEAKDIVFYFFLKFSQYFLLFILLLFSFYGTNFLIRLKTKNIV
jgi:hypothetical protein